MSKKGLIVGIANDKSIAYGCAKAFAQRGDDLAVTYLNAKAERFVRPLAEAVGAGLILPLDVARPGELEAVFDAIRTRWGRLDYLVHSIAFAADLHGRVIDTSPEGFAKTMDVSVHSFLRMAKLAEPLMTQGGTMLTVSYFGSEKVVSNYNVMGIAKAGLEAAVRYTAAELGGQGIRVHAVSPGPLATRAASGIGDFDGLLAAAVERSPEHRLTTIEEVGKLAAFLSSDDATSMTGGVHYIDGGYNIMG
jgi:enoyl-[acyl-carrier protein] reductase I